MKIYVDNLPYRATDTDLKKHFEQYGRVTTATINLHQSGPHQGKSNGSGTVVMENREEGERAIEALDNQEIMGRPLRIREHQSTTGHQPPSDGTLSTEDEHDCFHNPYTFIPTSPRPLENIVGEFAGDFDPLDDKRGLDHASLKDHLWTGHIPIKLTTVTPLVLLKDDGRKRDPTKPTKHQTYDVHSRIPESSLRGILRSAYEVVTNSRYACFGREHKEKLAYRMDPEEAAILIPAIIKNGDQPGKLVAQLCTGTSVPTNGGPKGNGAERAMYAAMFNPYNNTNQQTEYDPGYTPKTGDEVWAQIVLCRHRRGYLYWKALKVWGTDAYPNRPTEEDLVNPESERWESLDMIGNPVEEEVVKGHVLITNKNIKGKHDERIFFTAMWNIFDVTTDLNEILENKGDILKTGEKVWVEIVRYKHEVSPKEETDWLEDHRFWKVVKVWQKNKNPNQPDPTGEMPETSEEPQTTDAEEQSYCSLVDPENRMVVEMYVSIISENVGSTHNKQVFLTEYPMPDVTDLKDDWKKLIKNYRDAHPNDDIFDRRGAKNKPWKKIGDDPGETAWSPHLYQDSKHWSIWRNNDPHGRTTDHDAIELKHGDMVYARCEFTRSTISGIKDLFPVTISRELYENAPEDLLDPSLRPATELDQLSPADRLFGWTPQGQGSDRGYKSRIRVVCEDSKCPTLLKDFKNNPLPLTILGQPKPEQGRFYVAADDKGTPQRKVKKKKDAGYDKNGKKQLRGRKHYWHHKGLEVGKDKAEDYWDPSDPPDPSKDQNREYIRTGRKKDPQNRSIKGWIEPRNAFEATLYVQNLQPEEVGALLWLLTLNKGLNEGDDKHYFRLGYGKPLGFGSVRIEIDTARLEQDCIPLAGNDSCITCDDSWKKYYASLDAKPPATLGDEQQNRFIQQFITSMLKAYKPSELKSIQANTPKGLEYLKHLKQVFSDLLFIKGFLRVLQGPNEEFRIHYPRTNPKRHPDGKNFEWFMDNERGRSYKVAGRTEVGKQLALPDVTKDEGLPYTPSKPKD